MSEPLASARLRLIAGRRGAAGLAVGAVMVIAGVVASVVVGWASMAASAPLDPPQGWTGEATGAAARIITPTVVAPATAAMPALPSVMEAAVPVRLVIPSIGVDTALMDLGLMPDGSLEVPPDGTLAGWYTGSPTPGERGPAVIAGHVDWRGPGVFHDLTALAVGDLVTVTRADASVATFAVTSMGQYPKNAFPTEAVYGTVDMAALRLITCGGVFNHDTTHYDDNVVVFAELVPPVEGA